MNLGSVIASSVAVAVTLAGCRGPDVHIARVPRSPATISVTDRYNPEHDPNQCVRVLDEGQVFITYIDRPAKGAVPSPAVATAPTVPVPPLGTCG